MSERGKRCVWTSMLALWVGLGSPMLGQASSDAKSIVGHWSCEVTRTDGSGFNVLHVFNAGGTSTSVAGVVPLFDATGSWEKKGPIYVSSAYSMIVREDGRLLGYLKTVKDFVLADKDHMTGETDALFLGGVDPLDPDYTVELSIGEMTECQRLPAEGLAR